jgi:NAD-dependent DNA ligase
MDVDEERQLIELLMAVIGGTPHTDDASYTCSLPLDDPPPAVTFPGQSFCFTGKFRFGTRAQCQEAVERLGAIVHDRPTMDTCYLVLGEIGSRDWVHSTHGRKIERAVELREEGRAIHIISEVQWVLHLPTKV